MALQTKITVKGIASITDNGFYAKTVCSISENVYVKVERVEADNSNCTAYVTFLGNTISAQKSYEFEISLDGENFIAQAYAYLKTLNEFADAVDC